MLAFPARHELLALFAAEPRVMDPELAWHHNTLEFGCELGDLRLELTIEASYGELTIRWLRAGSELLHLQLHDVERLEVERERGREALLIGFGAARRFEPLRLQLRPQLHLLGGMRR